MFIISSCERMHFMVKKWKHFSIISMRFILHSFNSNNSIRMVDHCKIWRFRNEFISILSKRRKNNAMSYKKKWYASDKLKHNLLYLYGSNIEIGKLLRCKWQSFYLSSSFKVTINVWICDIKRIVLQITFSF